MVKYTEISGPISMTVHYNRNTNKTFYIFGDDHFSRREMCKNCINLKCPDHIANITEDIILNNPDKTIDIFTESTFMIRIPESGQLFGTLEPDVLDSIKNAFRGPLEDFITKFINCLDLDKSKCQYPNLRAHYVDIRFNNIGVTNNIFENFKIILRDIVDIARDELRKRRVRTEDRTREGNKILKEKLKILFFPAFKRYNPLSYSGKQFQKLADQVLIDGKALEQYENVEEETKEIIFEELRKVFSFLFKEHDKIRKQIIQRIDNNTVISSRLYNSLIENIATISARIMDTYALGRMFRTFTTRGREGPEIRNSIVYMGDDHSEFYRKVLKELNFKLVDKAREKRFRCLDVSKVKQPFFTYDS